MDRIDTKTSVNLTVLETVYPPVSNQEAVWLQGDPETEARLRESDFYLIAGRAEAKFLNFERVPERGIVKFDFAIGDDFSDPVEVHCYKIPEVVDKNAEELHVEIGEKLIKIWDGPINGAESTILDWFTTEKLIWDRSRGHPGVGLFNDYLAAAEYDLLYVGIAKVGDSYNRLIKNGHKARQDILSNEPQRYPGARTTDEIYLFLFRASPLVMTTFENDHNFESNDFDGEIDVKKIVADAEKAFVNLLLPEYNVVKFKNYPRGADGLYGSEFVRYGYLMAESFQFNTAHCKIRGGRDPISGLFTNRADCILVEEESVQLYLSGVDFPSR